IYVYMPNFCYFTLIKSKVIIFCSVLHLLPSVLRCGPQQAAQHPPALISIPAPISLWGRSPRSPFMSAYFISEWFFSPLFAAHPFPTSQCCLGPGAFTPSLPLMVGLAFSSPTPRLSPLPIALNLSTGAA
uniref:Uncharacterized protein n=1 Tax=Gallus gallus TaxID=9031 RepID=A0A8V0Z418_CHICK